MNQAGGINGHIIKLVTVDSSSSLDTSLQRVGSVVRQHRPVALLNYYGSVRTQALIKSGLLAINRVPVVGAVVSSTSVRQDPENGGRSTSVPGYRLKPRRWCGRLYRWAAGASPSFIKTIRSGRMACARAPTR